MSQYLRGQLAKMTGLNIETLRFYENYGLISVPKRTDSGYRLYTDDDLYRLEFIKRAKNAGFSLDEIKQLLLILDNKTINEQMILQMLEKKTEDIDRKISELNEIRAFLLKVKANISNPDKCPLLQSILKENITNC